MKEKRYELYESIFQGVFYLHGISDQVCASPKSRQSGKLPVSRETRKNSVFGNAVSRDQATDFRRLYQPRQDPVKSESVQNPWIQLFIRFIVCGERENGDFFESSAQGQWVFTLERRRCFYVGLARCYGVVGEIFRWKPFRWISLASHGRAQGASGRGSLASTVRKTTAPPRIFTTQRICPLG